MQRTQCAIITAGSLKLSIQHYFYFLNHTSLHPIAFLKEPSTVTRAESAKNFRKLMQLFFSSIYSVLRIAASFRAAAISCYSAQCRLQRTKKKQSAASTISQRILRQGPIMLGAAAVRVLETFEREVQRNGCKLSTNIS